MWKWMKKKKKNVKITKKKTKLNIKQITKLIQFPWQISISSLLMTRYLKSSRAEDRGNFLRWVYGSLVLCRKNQWITYNQLFIFISTIMYLGNINLLPCVLLCLQMSWQKNLVTFMQQLSTERVWAHTVANCNFRNSF